MKRNPIYAPGRNAVLCLRGSPRFYNPLSAIRLCVPEYKHALNMESLVNEIKIIEAKESVTIWHTPLGDFATPTVQTLDNFAIARLVDEFQRNVYLAGPVRVAPGAIVLDIGGYVGLFARQAIRLGAGHVICVEPTPDNIPALRWNVAPSSLAKVSILSKGVWDKKDVLRFHVNPKDPTSNSCVQVLAGKDTYEITVNVEPLDFVVEQLKLPRVDFIKMDIEGAELRALAGAKDLLLRDKPQLAIAVEHTSDRLRNASAVRDLILSINPAYRCIPGPYSVSREWSLLPDILYFK